MKTLTYSWRAGADAFEWRMVRVPGTNGVPFRFGGTARHRLIEVRPFYMATTPVTQALWRHIMGSSPAVRQDPQCPVENVSWHDITAPGGFLDRLNASTVRAAFAQQEPELRFRLPSESEWDDVPPEIAGSLELE